MLPLHALQMEKKTFIDLNSEHVLLVSWILLLEDLLLTYLIENVL